MYAVPFLNRQPSPREFLFRDAIHAMRAFELEKEGATQKACPIGTVSPDKP
jgi:hypothetical protein